MTYVFTLATVASLQEGPAVQDLKWICFLVMSAMQQPVLTFCEGFYDKLFIGFICRVTLVLLIAAATRQDS